MFIWIVVLCFSTLHGVQASEKENYLTEGAVGSDIDVDIRKRAEWVDKDTGRAKITLQYSSNSGEVVSTKDMNVVLVHDKSGTMDVNYGYNIQKVQKGWEKPIQIKYYPLLNTYGWSESISDIENVEGYVKYFSRINYKDSLSDMYGYNNGELVHEEMHYASPCLLDAHYYLLLRQDPSSGINGFRMVHGNNLQDISNTDLHHYEMITRDEALEYLAEGRRVIRQTEGAFYNEEGVPISITDENGVYFLDLSEVHRYSEGWILSACGSEKCQGNDRLSMSQAFYTNLVDNIFSRNKYNKIAYVPFWGDVPDDGRWENLTGSDDNTGLVGAVNSNPISYKEGVSKVDFTDDAIVLKNQIDNNFTYRGTNWSRAFQNVINLLNSRRTEDKKRETLVIFLTDGVPQGYNGKNGDKLNPEINGLKQLEELKRIEGVTVYACGVGVNESDTTGLRENILAVDSDAGFARSEEMFAGLSAKILNRISEQYSISIAGVDAFYADRLNSDFDMDIDGISSDGSWAILPSASSGTTKGVPTNVYDTVVNSTKINKVYVANTKTIYWHIGNMTSGSYAAPGHTMFFNIKYSNYAASTGGNNITLTTNTIQKLTYYTTVNEDRMNQVVVSSPQIIFNREDSQVTINKTLVGANFATDQSYRFVYSNIGYAGGIVKNVLGSVNVVVKAGMEIGSSSVSGLKNGTYYFYEVDKANNIINPWMSMVHISDNAAISTSAYLAGGIPWAITKSDDDVVYNNRNVLKIEAANTTVNFTNNYVKMVVKKVWDDSNDSLRPSTITVNLLRDGERIDSKILAEKDNWEYTFENLQKYSPDGREYDYTVSEDSVADYETDINYASISNGKTATITNKLTIADLTITKVIKTNEIVWEHGNPIFIVKISGVGYDGKQYTFYHTFEFTETYVKENVLNGEVSLSYTLKNIPVSSDYKVEEMRVSRYRLSRMEIDGYGTVDFEESQSITEFYGICAKVDLEKKPKGTEVILHNEKNNYQLLSHNAYLKNAIK